MVFRVRRSATLVSLLCCICLSHLANARPATIHEEHRIALPTTYTGASDVCLRGEDLLVFAHLSGLTPEGDSRWAVVHLRRQAAGDWQFVQELASGLLSSGDYWHQPQLTCEGSLAALATQPPDGAFIFERGATGWGNYGLITYGATAEFDTFRVVRP